MGDKKCLLTAQITESDIFLRLSLTAQCLYFHYCINADNDGFVKNPMSILRMINSDNSKYDDLLKAFEELKSAQFVIEFNDGVIVITHWHIHNALRKDRYKETEFTEHRAALYIKPNLSYTLDKTQGQAYNDYMVAKWLPSGCQKVAPSKDKLSKDKINIYSTEQSKKSANKGMIARDNIDYEELREKVFAN